MSDVFFEDLEIPKPNFMLSTGGGSHTKQTQKDDDRYRRGICKRKTKYGYCLW